MILYFMRHGAALSREEWNREEIERPLTAKGRKNTEKQARRFGREIRLDRIYTSPYVRAYQTADIIASVMEIPERVIVDERLGPGFDYDKLSAIVRENPKVESLLLVSHEPDLSSLVGQITGGGRLNFRKGALAEVELTDPESLQGVLSELISPRFIC
jgi:phosphohistidine phosphatase